MTVTELLARLAKVKKQGTGWVACCPAHEDASPSLSVGIGKNDQILLRCFAGCTLDDILASLSLSLADLRQAPADRWDVQPALAVPPVADWLRKVRGLPDAEIAQIFASRGRKGLSVVFEYRDEHGGRLYQKHRALDTKAFWRKPAGTKSVLYGLETLSDSDPERVIVVEGELDAHTLRSVGISAVVSVPDGCGSKLDPDCLAPLAFFREVVIATDIDEPGDELAARLARALGPDRCLRARFATEKGKDANDALRSGWGRDDFEAAIAAAAPMSLPDAAEPRRPSEADEPDHPYRIIDGHFCYVRTDRSGGQIVKKIAKFTAFIEEDVLIDDGAETRREFRISGALADGTPLPIARVPVSEFGGLTWVGDNWGARAVIGSGQGAKEQVRHAIQLFSQGRVKSRTIYRHTGWCDLGGKTVFLYQGGAVGAEGVEVDLPPPLDRYRLPPAVEDRADAVRWSLSFLDIAPLEITVPLLAAVCISPVASLLAPDLAAWVHGVSGSLKSTVAALALAHFGDFDRKALSASWTSTENFIEHRLFVLKDVLAVVDDYAPQGDPAIQREIDRRVIRVIRNMGNRTGRGRLNADLSARPDRPPRGMLLCTGEELPPGYSINARLFQVEVDRKLFDMEALTRLQANAGRLAHATRGYIEWLQPQLHELKGGLLEAMRVLRNELAGSTTHSRQAEAIANLYVAFDLYLQYAEAAAAIERARADELRGNALEALKTAASQQSRSLVEISPGEVFIEALSILLTQKKVTFIERYDEPTVGEPEMIGWRQGEHALILPHAAYRRVAMFTRDRGEHWGPSLRELRKELVAKGHVVPATDGRDDTQWRIGPERQKQRGWLLRLDQGGRGGRPRGASNLGTSEPASDVDPSRLHERPTLGGKETEAKSLKYEGLDPDLDLLPPEPPRKKRGGSLSSDREGEG